MRARYQAGNREPVGHRTVAAWALLGLALLAALHAWQGSAYWEYSDGVYAYSARAVLDGLGLYEDFAGAQPPPIFYAGAALLAISDTPAAIRIGMAALELATSGLVLVVVWRLTHSRPAALVAALVALVTPWTLREHAQLLPETFAAPLLMAAALAASRPRLGYVAGALGALATAFKLAFLLPALAIALAGREALRGVLGLVLLGLLLADVFLLAFGAPFVDQAVQAQREAGLTGLRHLAGLWAQAGWNLLPLLVPALLAWPFRALIQDGPLARATAGAAIGSLLLLGTLLKEGSYLTALVVIEPPLVCLAAVGALGALRAVRGRAVGVVPGLRRPVLVSPRRARAALVAVACATALGLVQIGSLLAAPDRPTLFARPFAADAPQRQMSSDEVDAAVAALRACPAEAAYGGSPYLAFVAERRMAGDQPDQFLIAVAPSLARFRSAIATEPALCP